MLKQNEPGVGLYNLFYFNNDSRSCSRYSHENYSFTSTICTKTIRMHRYFDHVLLDLVFVCEQHMRRMLCVVCSREISDGKVRNKMSESKSYVISEQPALKILKEFPVKSVKYSEMSFIFQICKS